MERFYYITNECEIGKNYWEYKNAENKLIKAFNDFCNKMGIKSTRFHPSDKYVWIEPVDEDIEKFGKDFVKATPGKFKKSSEISKAWAAKCKEEDITYIDKPFVPFMFSYTGRSKYRLFDVDNKIYCTFDCAIEVEAPEGFVQMKGSEFYKIMESYHIEL